MRATLLPALLALLPAVSLAAVPRVAVVHSAWANYAFRDEFDPPLQALGWPAEKVENVKIADLIPRLADLDLVISAGVGNYENPQDMTPYREQWLAYLEGGGVLLITDASYGSVLDQWVNTFGDDYRLTAAQCAPMRDPSSQARAITAADHPLVTVPNSLPALFAARTNIWAHLESWPKGWQSLVTCRDGKSLYVARPVGRGLVVVTSEYSFKGPGGQETARTMLENLWLYAETVRKGLVVTRLAFGPLAPGPGAAELSLRNLTDAPLGLRAWISSEGEGVGRDTGPTVEASLPPGGGTELRVPFEVTGRGARTERLTVESASGDVLVDWPRRVEIPSAVTLDLRRKHLYPQAPELAAAIRVCPDTDADVQGLKLEYAVDGAQAVPLSRWERDRGEGALEIDAHGLSVGEHVLSVRLLAGDRPLGEATAGFFVHPEPRVALRRDGVTLIDGQPLFPFGFYHVSWTFDAAHRMEMAQDCAAAGFSVIHAGIKDLDEWGPLLDECEELGVYVATEFGVAPEQVIERYRGHPALLSWNPGDEPELNNVSPETMFSRYDQFKQLDPDRLVYTTCASPGEYARYARGTDVLAPDPYPIPNGPVATVYSYLKQARLAASPHGTTVWGILQCFGGYGGWTRPPTAKELRAMTYLALLAGAKGIIYYTYADSGWQVTEHPEQWEAAKALVPEMKLLSPAILDGTFTLLAEGEGDLFAGYWDYQGRRYVVVVNNVDQERPFDLPVPGMQAEPLFAQGAAPTLEQGRLHGTVEGLGTVVVVVDG